MLSSKLQPATSNVSAGNTVFCAMMEDVESLALQGRNVNSHDSDLLLSLEDVPKSEQTVPLNYAILCRW